MRSSIALTLLTLILGFTLLEYGGTTAPQWDIALAALCLLSLFFWFPGQKFAAPPLSPASLWFVGAIVLYPALQLLPLPAAALKFLSPNRFELREALKPFQNSRWSALSVSAPLTFAHLLRLLAYILIFFLIRELTYYWRRKVWISALPLLGCATIQAIIGLTQHFETGVMATGTYINHSHFAGLLELVLPFSLMLIPLTLRQGSTLSTGKAALVCLEASTAALLLLGVLYSASRSAFAAAALEILIMAALVLTARRERKSIALLVILGALAALLLSAPLILISRYQGDLTSDVRFDIWKDSLKLIAAYPVFGSGLGTYVSAVQKYRSAMPRELVDYAHNDYLQLLAELGTIGFLILLAAGARLMAKIFQATRGTAPGDRRLIAIAAFSSLAGIGVHSITDFQAYIPANMMAAAWIAGIAAGIGSARVIE